MTDIARMIRENADTARETMLREIVEHWDELVEFAVERATTEGVEEYGTEGGGASFHKTPEQVARERFAEYADAIFYAQLEPYLRRRLE